MKRIVLVVLMLMAMSTCVSFAVEKPGYEEFSSEITDSYLDSELSIGDAAVLICKALGIVPIEAQAQELSNAPGGWSNPYLKSLNEIGLTVDTEDGTLQFCKWLDSIKPQETSYVSTMGTELTTDGVFSKKDAISVLWQLKQREN